MSTADIILGFDFNPAKYEGYAKRAFDDEVIVSNIKRLVESSDKLVESLGAIPEVNFEQLFHKLYNAFNSRSKTSLSITQSELRALSYNICPDWKYKFLEYCLDILDKNWKVIYLRGLLHCLLLNWEDFKPDNREVLLRRVESHINNDNSRTAEVLKPMKGAICDPYLLGHTLRKNGKTVISACSLFGIPTNRLAYSYFTEAICSYYEKIVPDELNEMFGILRQHNNIKADKTVIPHWILGYKDESKIPKELVDFAIDRIGDPYKEEKWAPFEFASREVQANLNDARLRLAAIISRKIINYFFELLCNDENRKRFWLKYTRQVTGFTVYGTGISESVLLSHINNDLLKAHFRIVSTNTTNCALCMNMGDYRIIEFTDSGALYVYNHGSWYYDSVFRHPINKLDDLKCPDMQMLVDLNSGYYHTYNAEGRMVHNGYWQTRLSQWLNRKI